ncbi:MAG: GAF domain-containing sensor histidine kinase [Methanothrix sp.]|nr:GAF domain-containing sensor histidine kinase [Methanothrix sp.]
MTDPSYTPWREEAAKRGYASSVALPLVADGGPFGALTIYASERDVFIEEENDLLRELADDVSYGIMTLRMREQHRLSEEELRRSHEQLHNLTAHLQSVREEERTRIARELHDELGQALAALKMDIFWVSNNLSKGQKAIFEKTKDMTRFVDETIRTTKKICTELRPMILDHLGITSAIEWQLKEVQKRAGLEYRISFDPEEITLEGDIATMIFRVFQEALTNIVRHSGATRVEAALKKNAVEIKLTVKDNGKGITKDQMAKPRSFGLLGIQERARSFGGDVGIKGIKGKGTTLTISIPIAQSGNARKPEL